MTPNQDKILEYLKANFSSITKDSTDEDRYMHEFMLNNGLMSPVGNRGGISITNAGKDFIGNSYYFNPVPLSVFEWKMNIINQIKNGEKILDGVGDLIRQALNELKQDGIAEQGSLGYYTTLTSKGRRYLDYDGGYNQFIDTDGMPNVSINHGNMFNGNIQNSRLNIDSSLETKKISNTNASAPIKKSFLEPVNTIVLLIIGILTVAMLIYEFVLKHISWR